MALSSHLVAKKHRCLKEKKVQRGVLSDQEAISADADASAQPSGWSADPGHPMHFLLRCQVMARLQGCVHWHRLEGSVLIPCCQVASQSLKSRL